jgi:hypothetical protein
MYPVQGGEVPEKSGITSVNAYSSDALAKYSRFGRVTLFNNMSL